MQLDQWKLEAAARAAHEANRAYAITLGDMSHAPWDDAPGDQRASAIAGVISVYDTPGLTPTEAHARWSAQKRADGWRHGDVKSTADKLHPCLVEWEQLPYEQQAKDSLFIAVVKAMLSAFNAAPQ